MDIFAHFVYGTSRHDSLRNWCSRDGSRSINTAILIHLNLSRTSHLNNAIVFNNNVAVRADIEAGDCDGACAGEAVAVREGHQVGPMGWV